jgi:hypothetical protein
MVESIFEGFHSITLYYNSSKHFKYNIILQKRIRRRNIDIVVLMVTHSSRYAIQGSICLMNFLKEHVDLFIFN